jgi:hypothetical protein
VGEVKVRRVVIDTNVVVSALLFGGTPGKLTRLWKSGRLRPLLSKEIMDEYLAVLAYPKFSLSEEEINFILYEEILPYFEVVDVKPGHMIVPQDPSDDKFIHCAEAGKAELIISGDEHLIALKSHGKLRILTPAQFLGEVSESKTNS